ncbi:hypothetical protein AAFC00_004266 [Neodothiora populina]|uniref:Uncharacterized protein n=1 Tax=Neodothiora populina TaxID=2781224 RepID=A0ABR3PJ54_9PEZI
MQGFNMGRYIPPEHEGRTSANKLAGKHALGARANKLKSEGILTVRFEMPYAVWCNHCPKPTIIGQGVRFNAEKKKVGNYYSTPIWSFRMKHVACGGVIEIRTDPKNTAYVVTEGGKARDTGEDKVREGEEGLEILSPEEREKRRADAFASLEGKKQDEVQQKEQGRRIRELYEAKSRDWEDPDDANRRLRGDFRVGRKERDQAAKADEKLVDKMSLHVELLPENEDDKRRAEFIDFGAFHDADESARKAASKPLFLLDDKSATTRHIDGDNTRIEKKPKKISTSAKRAAEAERRRTALQQEIRDNTRAAKDPFLTFASVAPTGDTASVFQPISGIKRKRNATEGSLSDEHSTLLPTSSGATMKQLTTTTTTTITKPALVAYDSEDSE